MEDELDEIAEGKQQRVPVLKEWWSPFENLVKEKDKTVTKEEVTHQPTDKPCPECKEGKLVIKLGRFGRFYGCSRFPECNYMAPLEEEAAQEEEFKKQAEGEKCPECGADMAVKRSRFGPFLGCTKYPDCKGTKPLAKKTGAKCPDCGDGDLEEKKTKRGRIFYGCSNYPKCEFASWKEPVPDPCPKCKGLVVKKGKDLVACTKCDYEASAEEVAEKPTAA